MGKKGICWYNNTVLEKIGQKVKKKGNTERELASHWHSYWWTCVEIIYIQKDDKMLMICQPEQQKVMVGADAAMHDQNAF